MPASCHVENSAHGSAVRAGARRRHVLLAVLILPADQLADKPSTRRLNCTSSGAMMLASWTASDIHSARFSRNCKLARCHLAYKTLR